MTKGRFFALMLILAGLSYCGLFIVDRWNADISGTITGLAGPELDPQLGVLEFVKIQTGRQSHDNPTGEFILILTQKTEILEQAWSRARNPVLDRELKLGQKVIANWSLLKQVPSVPPAQTVREVVIMKW
jgi:hypothetical protein